MTDINKVFLIGRLTRDAELKSLTNTSVCNFSIAVNRGVKDASGNWGDEVHYFDIELYGRQGEAIQRYLQKGKQVGIEGSLRHSRWEDSSGGKRSKVSVVAANVQLLSNAGGDGSRSQYTQAHDNVSAGSPSAAPSAGSDIDDDIPF